MHAHRREPGPAAIGVDLLLRRARPRSPRARDAALAQALAGPARWCSASPGSSDRDRRFPLAAAAPRRCASRARASCRCGASTATLQSRPEIDRAAAGRGLLSVDAADRRDPQRAAARARRAGRGAGACRSRCCASRSARRCSRVEDRGGERVELRVGDARDPGAVRRHAAALLRAARPGALRLGRRGAERQGGAGAAARQARAGRRDRARAARLPGHAARRAHSRRRGARADPRADLRRRLPAPPDRRGAGSRRRCSLAAGLLPWSHSCRACAPQLVSAAARGRRCAGYGARPARVPAQACVLDVAGPALGALRGVRRPARRDARRSRPPAPRCCARRRRASPASSKRRAASRWACCPCRASLFAGEARFALDALLEPARTVGGDFYDCFMVDAESPVLRGGRRLGQGAARRAFSWRSPSRS